MNISDRYITKTLFSFTATVLIVWMGVYGFFNFLEEMSSVGKASYSSLHAMRYIILQMPDVIYNHSTSIILLGCVLGMGHLATSNQLIVMRISGISIFKITMFTIKIALIFVFLFIILGEVIAPFSSEEAERGRSRALELSTVSKNEEGFWIKDGSSFINVKKNIDGEIFDNISIFEINPLNFIDNITTAERAIFDGKSLEMINTQLYSIDESIIIDNISYKEMNSLNKFVSFDKDLINSLKKTPQDLTTWKIIKQINYLSDNKLRADIFEVELYKRLARPLTLIAMILVAMLFIFGSNRSETLGRKIFFGIALGLSFEMISRIGGAFSLGFEINPIISAIVPSFAVMLIALVILTLKSSK